MTRFFPTAQIWRFAARGSSVLRHTSLAAATNSFPFQGQLLGGRYGGGSSSSRGGALAATMSSTEKPRPGTAASRPDGNRRGRGAGPEGPKFDEEMSIAPPKKPMTKLGIDAWLTVLHGPANVGAPGGDIAKVSPKVLAFDVRSPGEYGKGHIPGAISLPLFTNDERAVVGIAYHKQGRFAAIKAGLKVVGPKMHELVDALQKRGAAPGDRILVYCWRGGMRSGSVGWLLSLCGYETSTLDGGYRAYRRWCKTVVGNDRVVPPSPIAVVGGCTGVGKTAVLHVLRAQGEQVMDLEGLAHHRGSAFGAMGMDPQPTNEEYENRLAYVARQADPAKPLWLEHESQHVGKCLVPEGIRRWVQYAPGGRFITMNMPQGLRVGRLVEDYCSQESLKIDGWTDELKGCIAAKKGGLAKKLGGQRVAEALGWIDQGKWDKVATMMLDYYDRLYTAWQEMSESDNKVSVDCPTADAADNATRVLAAYHSTVTAQSQHSHSATTTTTDARSQTATTAAPATDGADVASTVEKAAASAQGAVAATAATAAAAASPPGPAATAAWAASPIKYQGACFCGEITVKVRGAPASVSYCHCSVCRRLTGAPFSCQAIFETGQVELEFEPGAQLLSTQTSRQVHRKRCGTCFAPISAEMFGGRVRAIPLQLLGSWCRSSSDSDATPTETTAKEALRPKHHLHYQSRVMDVVDGLPKYAEGANLKGKRREEVAPTVPEVDGNAPAGFVPP